tara:strand:+ start:112 stop:267 length:156 start_codon:yes stop_codon:yes gene_type:complete
MSMLSKYIEKQIKKRGAKGMIIWVMGLIAESTPSKKDDEMVEKIKKVMKEF